MRENRGDGLDHKEEVRLLVSENRGRGLGHKEKVGLLVSENRGDGLGHKEKVRQLVNENRGVASGGLDLQDLAGRWSCGLDCGRQSLPHLDGWFSFTEVCTLAGHAGESETAVSLCVISPVHTVFESLGKMG